MVNLSYAARKFLDESDEDKVRKYFELGRKLEEAEAELDEERYKNQRLKAEIKMLREAYRGLERDYESVKLDRQELEDLRRKNIVTVERLEAASRALRKREEAKSG